MNTILRYAQVLAPIATAVVTALTPFEGKHAWFVGLVAGMGAISLMAPSIMPPRSDNAVPPKG